MSAQVTVGLRAGDVVRYTPKSTWCHDGTAIARQWGGRLVLMDTYWVGQGGDSVVAPDAYEVLYNLADYDVRRRDEWESYSPADRQYIGKQHGCYPTYLVRKGALPDLTTQIENAEERLREAESQLQSAQHAVDFAASELAALRAEAEQPS